MNHLGRKILKSVLSFAIAMQTPVAFAVNAKEVVSDVNAQLKRIPGTKAAFCFAVENGPVTGVNENIPVRMASVTKTITTFWAVESLGPNFQYTTHVYLQNVPGKPGVVNMHIQGQNDPFFDRDRLFSLLADLNRAHIKQIDHLTFDQNFWFWPDATEFRYAGGGGGGARKGKAGAHGKASRGGKVQFRLAKTHAAPAKGHGAPAKGKGRAAPARKTAAKPAARKAGARKTAARPAARGKRRHAMMFHEQPSRMPASIGRAPASAFFESEAHTDKTIAGDLDKVQKNLVAGFNTAQWSASLKGRYARARSMNPVLQLPESVQMSVGSVSLIPRNPLWGQRGTYEFLLKSAPLKTFLKKMNIHSINPYAEEIFFSLGGKSRFKEFMQKRFAYGTQVNNVNTGSGVNMHGGNRNDSMMACSSVVKMIRRMDQDLESKYRMDLSDVLAVPGIDGGTWHDASKSLVVKTGTLHNPYPSKNLAGVKETKSGEVYFGIFVDKRGGNSGTVLRILTAFGSNFQSVQVKEAPYSFQPFGGYTHMALKSPAVKVAGK